MKDVKRDKLRFVLLCLLLLCSVDSLTWTGQPANPTEAIKGNNVVLTWNYSLTTAEQTNSQQFFAIEWSKFNLSSLVFDRIAIKTFVALVGVPSYQEPLSPHIVVDRNHKTDSVSLHISDVRRDDEGQYKIEYLEDFAGTVLADLVMNLTVLVSPTVISENQTVTEGEDLSLLCSAKGKPQPRTTLIELSSNSVVSGNFTSISREDAGGYNCTADNGVGSPVSKVVFIDVQYPPEGIQLRVSEEEVCNGKTISFICSAETANPMNLNYQLYENNTMIDVISSTGVWNKTSWTVEGVFFYKCVVNNSVGTAMSLNVSVNVNVSSFIMPISNEVITEGGTLNLSCPATGIPRPTVFWVKTSNGERTDGTELVIRNISRSEAGEYRCEATNPCGNASESATIDVQYPPEGIQLLVSEEEVCNGTTISFNCSAETANPMKLNYQLYENNTMIGVISSTGVWNKTSWTVGGVFFYKCVVNNSVGTAMSLNVSVNVNVSSFITPISNEVITEGGTLNLSCPATGIPRPTVFWVKTSNGERTDGTELVIRNISRSEAGEYRCEATNPCGNASESATIDVQYPPEGIQLHVSEVEVCNGTTISFSCSAVTANPMKLNYQLHENNTMIGVISSTGVWNKTSWTVGGVFFYKCVVNNSVGTAMSLNVSVNVNVSSFIMPISNEVITEGGTLNLSCPATGIPPPTVFWMKTSNGERTDGTELVIRNISRSEAGEYRCEATNPCGNASESATIDVQYAAEATGRGGNYSVREGSTELFSCPVDGNPEPTITWYKDNELIEPAIPNAKQLEAGETGCYTCSAINMLGPPVTITQCLIVEPEEPTPTGQQTNQVYAELTMREEYVSEYRDLDNQVSKQLVYSFQSEMDKVYQNNSNYIRTEVTGLRNGSVIVSFTLYFKNSVTPNEGLKELQAAISNGTLGTYQVGNLTLLPSGVSTFTSTTPRTAEPTDRPTWIIIVAVTAGVVLLALVVTFVTWWVHKKRKCIKDTKIHNSECEESLHGDSPHAKVNRAYAESGPPSASGTQGAARQQSQDLGAIPTYAVVDKSKKKKKKEEKPPIYASVDKSKKRKKKTDDKNLYDNVEEPKKEKKPGEVLYAELGDFQNPAMPQVSTSPETLPPLKRAPSYEKTQYADITAFLKGDATLPQKEGNEGSEMQQQSVNQSQHDVDNKETPIQEDSPCSRVNGAYAKSGPPSANSTDVSSAAQKQPAQEAGAIPTYAVVDKSKKKKKEPEEMPLVNTDKGKSKKKKKKTYDKNLYDRVEEPKKEKKPGEIFYADLGEFQKQEMPKVATSPPTLPPLKRAPSYEKTDYADITQFLRKEATLPKVATSPPTLPPIKRAPSYEKTGYAEKEATLPPEKTPNSEMKPQAANQTHDEVENKETAL
ncbi:hemicentin-2-like isoform X2 [Montipora foliosa]|uniref:hemicentin-2-like isoform X2 n=1 Tax=Montipora foliosa TaxID=591990 RepID=UPI0035F1BB2D